MDPARAIADLRELHRLTGGPEGARRVAWTDEWKRAREYLRERLDELSVDVERDPAGNLWAFLEGESDQVVAIGSHVDSVPAGGWLDGALGVFGALEALRCLAAEGRPPRTVALVDWADEEGARFGRSLLGSSAFAGTLDLEATAKLTDADGVSLPDAVAAHGVDFEQMNRAGDGRRERLAAYLELHIEQGPVLEAEGLPCGAVLGTFGVERWRASLTGRAGHAGSTPMDRRADAGVAAARGIVALQEMAREHGGVSTTGRADFTPGIVTAVAGRAEVLVDQRHLDPEGLAVLRAEGERVFAEAARAEGCELAVEPIWSIEPVPFHAGLVDAAAQACAAVAGEGRRLPSGALHDASELARVCPATMIFSSSVAGVSHSPEEDTPDADLERALTAYGALVERVVAGGVP